MSIPWTETEQPPNKAGTLADARKRREEKLAEWTQIVRENAELLESMPGD